MPSPEHLIPKGFCADPDPCGGCGQKITKADVIFSVRKHVSRTPKGTLQDCRYNSEYQKCTPFSSLCFALGYTPKCRREDQCALWKLWSPCGSEPLKVAVVFRHPRSISCGLLWASVPVALPTPHPSGKGTGDKMWSEEIHSFQRGLEGKERWVGFKAF